MCKSSRLYALLLMFCIPFVCRAEGRVVGGDISLIPAYEQAGDQWLDAEGNIIPDLITFLHDEAGWTSARVRLMVDPTQDSDPGTCQDLEYVKQLGRRIKEAGMQFLLDIFYSDTWTDPAQQWIPQSWNMDKTTSTKSLVDKVRAYTTESINALVEAGVSPDYVQIGNEVSYGMLWDNLSAKDESRHVVYLDSKWFTYEKQEAQIVRLASLLGAAAEGVRASDAMGARIILHIERSGEPEWARNFYEWVGKAGFTDYDIIGLSYYPFWHGDLSTLSSTVRTLRTAMPGKEIHLVETAYNYQWGPSDAVCKDWEFTKEGQASFLHDLVDTLNALDVKALYYWFPEECGNGKSSTVQRGWINRGLWTNGNSPHALNSREALDAFKAFAPTSAVKDIKSAVICNAGNIYDMGGRRLYAVPEHGAYIRGNEKCLCTEK
ncbi:MAG: glycosyl hydrolase 53 family protein [Bacteroidaceae bacterium]|nr:glycosyl hydrolase 53 family protein [Bacteroidaceae bacterium]